MADVFAITDLFDAVVARFALDGLEVANVFGWREPAKKVVTGPRIAWIPGDDSGALGEVGGPKFPGRNPRPLANLAELVTVEITSSDKTAATSERAQYVAVRLVFDAWYRAVYLHSRGNFEIIESGWIVDKKELRNGAALRVVLALNAMIPDAVRSSMPTDTRAVVDVEMLDVTDEIATADAPPAARVATTAAISLLGEQTIDGIALVAGDRALVKDQALSASNGIYVCALGAWSRSDDVLEDGFFVHVESGAVNGGAGFELTADDPIVLETTSLVFARVSP